MSGGAEPQFWPIESTAPGHKGVTAIGYRDMPESGLLLGVTYGLSLARQEPWRVGRPELSISVRSDDPAWVLAIACLAEQLRHDCPFTYGNTINFGEPVAVGSSLDGFVVFGPLAFDPDDARVDVGDDLPIVIVGMYPTYAIEREFIAENGLEAFWKLEWDPYDVARPPAV
jgi:Suppressor of fused protein (SUFU)